MSPTRWISGILYSEVKRLERESDHLPPYSSEVKNTRSFTSTPSYIFMAWCLRKGTTMFTFYTTWDFHGDKDSSPGLLRWDTVRLNGSILAFRRTILPPSSRWLVSYYITTRCHYPEDRDFNVYLLLKALNNGKEHFWVDFNNFFTTSRWIYDTIQISESKLQLVSYHHLEDVM
jgi:hypothetical protein